MGLAAKPDKLRPRGPASGGFEVGNEVAVGIQAQASHQRNVTLKTVLVVADHVNVGNIVDTTRLFAKASPYRWVFPIHCHRTIYLGGAGSCTPLKIWAQTAAPINQR